jgi:hypothetical protein
MVLSDPLAKYQNPPPSLESGFFLASLNIKGVAK